MPSAFRRWSSYARDCIRGRSGPRIFTFFLRCDFHLLQKDLIEMKQNTHMIKVIGRLTPIIIESYSNAQSPKVFSSLSLSLSP